jgi:hypothetical protein
MNIKNIIKQREGDKIWEDVEKRLSYVPVMPKAYVHEETESYIIHVLSHLPKDVIDFCANKVMFAESRRNEKDVITFASCLDKNSINEDYVINFDSSFQYLPKDYKLYVICHEIAHAFLGHGEEVDNDISEKEADEFTVEHNFPQPGEEEITWALAKQLFVESSLKDKIIFSLTTLVLVGMIALSFFDWSEIIEIGFLSLAGIIGLFEIYRRKNTSPALKIFGLILLILLVLVYLEFLDIISLI